MTAKAVRASSHVAATLCLATALPVAGQTGTDGLADGLPLATPRTLRFTADEGTWLSVDVSPDGSTLVFDLLGDLYTLPIEGGRATRITSGQAFDAMPRFSPDGRHIAFITDRSGASNLWIANADGSDARPLSRTSGYWIRYVSPAWSPDGRSVLVARNNGPANSGLSNRRPTPYDFYLFDVDGGDARRLTGSSPPGGGFGGRGAADHFGAAFGGPRLIWYSTAGENAQIHTLDTVTREVVRRTDREGGAVRPVLSRDGSWLVYATRREGRTALRLRDLETGDERWLALDVQHDQMSSWPTMDLMPGMAFTPDGAALVTSYRGKLWRLALPSGKATPIPFTAEVDQRIAASTQFQYPLNDSSLRVRHIRAASLSPDGRRVAFVALDRIWIADLPAELTPGVTIVAENPRRVTSFEQSEYGPAWSPDGRTLAFVTWNDSIGGDIYRIDVEGGRPERLSRTHAFYEKLAYTPDGAKLVFARASRASRFEHDEVGFGGAADVGADLMWMPAGGGEPTTITHIEYLRRPVPPSYGIPHFGPDPDRLLLYDARNDGLYSMRLDGTDRRLVMKASGRLWNASGVEPAHDIVLSPAGDRAAILGMQHVFVTRLPPGREAPEILLARDSSHSTRRLSEVGGEFVGWSADGRLLHYSIGATLFVHDVARADSLARLTPDRTRADRPTRIDIRITLPKDRPEGVLALRGAGIVTMRGSEVIERGDVVVRGNRITALGPSGTVAIPAGAEVMDVEGATIIPGYVDTHAHMGSPGWGVHRTELWQYYVTLAYGVTTIRDPQTMTADVFDYADRVETGDMIGPRVYATGRAFFAGDDVASLEDAHNALRRNAEFLRSETVKLYVVGDRQRSQWYLQAAQELGLSPTSEGDANLLMDLTHLMDGYAGLEHTLPTFPLYEDVVHLAAASGTTYTPVLTISYGGPNLQEYFTSRYDMRDEPKLQRFWPRSYMERRTSSTQWRPDERYAFPEFAADAAKIAAAGGRVAVGSHGNLLGIGYHCEMWGLAMGGMPAHAVLRSATLRGAQAIGHAADLGSIDVGKLADLQILDRNPLDDIRNTNSVRLVMKNGRLYDANTLDEIWPRKRSLPRNQWWMASERR